MLATLKAHKSELMVALTASVAVKTNSPRRLAWRYEMENGLAAGTYIGPFESEQSARRCLVGRHGGKVVRLKRLGCS